MIVYKWSQSYHAETRLLTLIALFMMRCARNRMLSVTDGRNWRWNTSPSLTEPMPTQHVLMKEVIKTDALVRKYCRKHTKKSLPTWGYLPFVSWRYNFLSFWQDWIWVQQSSIPVLRGSKGLVCISRNPSGLLLTFCLKGLSKWVDSCTAINQQTNKYKVEIILMSWM